MRFLTLLYYSNVFFAGVNLAYFVGEPHPRGNLVAAIMGGVVAYILDKYVIEHE